MTAELFILASEQAAWQYKTLQEPSGQDGVILINAVDAVTLTGLSAPGKKIVRLVNRGDSVVTLEADSTEVGAAYRFNETGSIAAFSELQLTSEDGLGWTPTVDPTGASETVASMGVLINGSASAVPNNTDKVAMSDASVLKNSTWTAIKAFLKTYFDTLYSTAAEPIAAAHIIDAADAHAATAITNTAAGSIAATTVQAAINELDGDVALKAFLSPTVREITAATDTITQADNGKILRANRATGQTLTVTTPIAAGFNCVIIQEDAGQTTFDDDGTTTIINRQSHLKIAGEGGVASLVCSVADIVHLGGDTAA